MEDNIEETVVNRLENEDSSELINLLRECKIQKKYNLNKICFHGLRHTSISLQIGNGIDVKQSVQGVDIVIQIQR